MYDIPNLTTYFTLHKDVVTFYRDDIIRILYLLDVQKPIFHIISFKFEKIVNDV